MYVALMAESGAGAAMVSGDAAKAGAVSKRPEKTDASSHAAAVRRFRRSIVEHISVISCYPAFNYTRSYLRGSTLTKPEKSPRSVWTAGWTRAAAVFLIGYGLARFTVEFAREPDDFLGLLAMGLSMGQWLSLPMILVGIALLVWSYRRAGRERTHAVSAG